MTHHLPLAHSFRADHPMVEYSFCSRDRCLFTIMGLLVSYLSVRTHLRSGGYETRARYPWNWRSEASK